MAFTYNITDPLTQAEAYIADGRFQAAAQVLRAAIEREPNRKDLWDKLEEIIRRAPYVARPPRPTVSSRPWSSGHTMDADGNEVLKMGKFFTFVCFFVSAMFGGGTVISIFSDRNDMPWIMVAIMVTFFIGILLATIYSISYSIKLTDDHMIASSMMGTQSLAYAEMGEISIGMLFVGKWSKTQLPAFVEVFNKEGERIFKSDDCIDMDELLEALLRRVNKYRAAAAPESPRQQTSLSGEKLFKIATSAKIIWYFLLIVLIVICFGAFSGPDAWPDGLPFMLFFGILILCIINIVSYSVKLTEDRMIVLRLAFRTSFLYAEIGKIRYIPPFAGSSQMACVEIYDKAGELLYTEKKIDDLRGLAAALQRRAGKYGAVYEQADTSTAQF